MLESFHCCFLGAERQQKTFIAVWYGHDICYHVIPAPPTRVLLIADTVSSQ